uniref:C2H2-type domain-containing protein n=1 Tax=Magallana gigas TaxID=29159 RepID=A0A8W8MMH7_MAGGI
MVRCTECPVTFANLRNLKRHQNQKHRDDVKMRKCPMGGCETQEENVDENQSSLEEDGEEPCVAEMEKSQPQEPHIIEPLETITLNLVTTQRTISGVTCKKGA